MKIQCGGCGAAEAKVFCCADEAALCLACDEKIHSANKLVSKHQRVVLSTSSSSLPKCDICQETFGYFICLEDRALLCRKCDVSIHTANSCVRRHQRFLLGGVRVGLESAALEKSLSKAKGLESAALDKSVSKVKLQCSEKVLAQPLISSAGADASTRSADNFATISARDPKAVEGHEGLEITVPDSRVATKNIADWRFKDILELIDTSSNSPSSQEGLFKATEGGNSEWWNILRSTEEELLNDDPRTANDISWTVPQLLPQYPISASSSPGETARTSSNYNVLKASDTVNAVVNDFQFHQNPMNAKRRRRPKRKAGIEENLGIY